MCQVIRLVILGVVVVVVGGLGYLTWKNYEARSARENQKLTIPNFSVENLDGSPFTHADLPVQAPVMMMYFNPDCDHCQREIEGIKENQEGFHDLFILMVTFADVDRVSEFMEAEQLDQYANMKVVLDPLDNFSRAFAAKEVPSTYLYGPDRALIQFWSGEVTAEAVLETLNTGKH